MGSNPVDMTQDQSKFQQALKSAIHYTFSIMLKRLNSQVLLLNIFSAFEFVRLVQEVEKVFFPLPRKFEKEMKNTLKKSNSPFAHFLKLISYFFVLFSIRKIHNVRILGILTQI